MRSALLFFWIFSVNTNLVAQTESYALDENLRYREVSSSDEYMLERCVLDVYYPVEAAGFATVVWFHGGGITGGEKYIPSELKNNGIAVVGVNYRLSPKVKNPTYIDDTAAAIAWVFANIDRYGGDPNRIFIAGHSAGGYLVTMVGLDKSWLATYGVDADRLAGIINFSGHSITHMTVRAERGIHDKQPVIDGYAPLYHIRKDAPLLVLISGDRELELLGRYEETAYMFRMMQVVGHKQTFLYELDGFDHGAMVGPGFYILLKYVGEKRGSNDS